MASDAPVNPAIGAGAPLILVGAGLASAILAQRLSLLPSPPRILILEERDHAFADRTWSFHDSDLDRDDFSWMNPLLAHRWRGQEVRFPRYTRRLATGYASLTTASVLRQIARLPNVEIATSVHVRTLAPDGVTLADGREVPAGCVVDARGHKAHPALALGYQKFVGLEMEMREPHGIVEPIIMDACVEQAAGYRFVYVLPFSQSRLLIEDTVYADGADSNAGELESGVWAYAERHGWSVREVVRRESGVLPIALAFDAARFWADQPSDLAQVGLRAALFHPTTGYSLPEAVRTANVVAAAWPADGSTLARRIRAHAMARARQQAFYRLLSRMLFRAAKPHERYRVLERFYRLPLPLIERFYAGRTTRLDMARILLGRPPVPLLRALACLREAPLHHLQPTS
jgi:lycopene beta-cyclase